MNEISNTVSGKGPCRMSAVDLVQALRVGAIGLSDVVESHLARIEQREPLVHAWAWHDPEAVRSSVLQLGSARGVLPLLGVPVGVKDIFDTADMPTAYGSPIYRHHRPSRDSSVVARLRAAGALIIGKTVTTEFAYTYPGPTVNPHNPAHTPGGSSSGSAAAVADSMVPIALGSQTGGSTIRPSAYCGIVGFKPTYGRVPTDGMMPLAPSMDTVGIHARTIEDVALMFSVLAGEGASISESDEQKPINIAYFPGPHAADAEESACAVMEATRERLLGRGVSVRPIALSAEIGRLSDANRLIMAVESAAALSSEARLHQALLSPSMQALIETGLRTSEAEYAAARRLAARCRDEIVRTLKDIDALLTFAAPGEAPRVTEGTGSSLFNRAWTTIGAPCVTLPVARGPRAGLPIGVQFVGRPNDDERLLAVCARLVRFLREDG
jgi:Asp-tRNA(Asn)/Glu-tRNA(Gln) amidotransferase A subunit family amidase